MVEMHTCPTRSKSQVVVGSLSLNTFTEQQFSTRRMCRKVYVSPPKKHALTAAEAVVAAAEEGEGNTRRAAPP